MPRIAREHQQLERVLEHIFRRASGGLDSAYPSISDLRSPELGEGTLCCFSAQCGCLVRQPRGLRHGKGKRGFGGAARGSVSPTQWAGREDPSLCPGTSQTLGDSAG